MKKKHFKLTPSWSDNLKKKYLPVANLWLNIIENKVLIQSNILILNKVKKKERYKKSIKKNDKD
jgi:hypothetical protein